MAKIEFKRTPRHDIVWGLMYDFDVVIDGERRGCFHFKKTGIFRFPRFDGQFYELCDAGEGQNRAVCRWPLDVRYFRPSIKRANYPIWAKTQKQFQSIIEEALEVGAIPTLAELAERAARQEAIEAAQTAEMTRFDLHFICKHQKNWSMLDAERFESGNWVVSEKMANEAIGGRIYLHERQKDAAWHGGTITQWRPWSDPKRKIFSYKLDGDFRVRCDSGWGNEKAVKKR
jgi:hypothetical protein